MNKMNKVVQRQANIPIPIKIGSCLIAMILISGIIFISLLAHEFVHISDVKEPISICYNFGAKYFMHVEFDSSKWITLDSLNDFMDYSETRATLTQAIFSVGLSFLCGMVFQNVVTKIWSLQKNKQKSL